MIYFIGGRACGVAERKSENCFFCARPRLFWETGWVGMDLQGRRSFQLAFFLLFLSLPLAVLFGTVEWDGQWDPFFCGGPPPARGEECRTTLVGCQFQFSSFHKGRRRPKKRLRINKARTGPVFDSAKKTFGIFSAHCMNVVGFSSI